MAQPTGTVNTTFYNDIMLQRRTDAWFRDDPIKTFQYRRQPFHDTSADKTDAFTPDGHMMNVRQGPLYINDLYTGRMQDGVRPTVEDVPQKLYIDKVTRQPLTRNNGVRQSTDVAKARQDTIPEAGIRSVEQYDNQTDLILPANHVSAGESIGNEDVGDIEVAGGVLAPLVGSNGGLIAKQARTVSSGINTSAFIASQRASGRSIIPSRIVRTLGVKPAMQELLEPTENVLQPGPVDRAVGVEIQRSVNAGARNAVLGNKNTGGTGDHHNSDSVRLTTAREPIARLPLQSLHNREVIPRRRNDGLEWTGHSSRNVQQNDSHTRLPRDPVSLQRTPLVVVSSHRRESIDVDLARLGPKQKKRRR